MLLFHDKWEKMLFSPRGMKSAREKSISAHFTHHRGSRSKTNSLFRFLSKQSGKLLLLRHAIKILPNIFSHSGERFYLVRFLPYWPHSELFPVSRAWCCGLRLGQSAQLLRLMANSTQLISLKKQTRTLNQETEYQLHENPSSIASYPCWR